MPRYGQLTYEEPSDEEKAEFEEKIQGVIKSIGDDYDISDLNANDRMVLRALAQSIINLEDYEMIAWSMRRQERVDIESTEKLNRVLTSLRSDISKLQDDLKITRKVRESDKEQSVLAVIDDLKRKAKDFYESRMSYVYCPRCGMLLGTFWMLNPKDKRNKVSIFCSRVLENGDTCGEQVNVTAKELSDKRGTNRPELMPEGLS